MIHSRSLHKRKAGAPRALLVLGAGMLLLAGCGGGGGGAAPPPVIPEGTFRATSNRAGAPAVFAPTVIGANSDGTSIQLYGDERTVEGGQVTASRRLTVTMYGPVQAGQALLVNETRAPGTAVVVYLESGLIGGTLRTTGEWRGTGGTININAVTTSRVEGTFAFSTRNAATGNTIQWSNGQFNVRFETPPPPGP
jgi:hypothetical protein